LEPLMLLCRLGVLLSPRVVSPGLGRHAVRRRSGWSLLGSRSRRDDGVGLLGFPELREGPSGFDVLASLAKDRCHALVQQLSSGAVEGPATLRALDEISDAVCSVCDMAEFVRNVHEVQYM
jgi:hypothetical protein